MKRARPTTKADETPEFQAFALPDREYLIECLRYDPDDGTLWWRARPSNHFAKSNKAWNARNAGHQAATSKNTFGHHRLSVNKRFYYAHRVIWKMEVGTEPAIIDHINGDPTDNRIKNLRSVDQATNIKNSDGAGRVRGVYKHSHAPGWYAQVSFGGRVSTKLFATEKEAIEWRIHHGRLAGFTDRHLGVAK